MKEPTTHYVRLAQAAQWRLIINAANAIRKEAGICATGHALTENQCSYIHAQAATIMAACEATLIPLGYATGKRKKPRGKPCKPK